MLSDDQLRARGYVRDHSTPRPWRPSPPDKRICTTCGKHRSECSQGGEHPPHHPSEGMRLAGDFIPTRNGIANPQKTWRGWRDTQPERNPVTIRHIERS